MRVCYSIVVGSVLIAALIQLWGAAPLDIVGEDASPKEEVAWLLDALRPWHGIDVMDWDDARRRAADRIYLRMQDRPEAYLPLLLSALDSATSSYAEAAALRTLSDPQLIPSFGRQKIHGILHGYVTGEREAISPAKSWSARSVAVSNYEFTAVPDDAWDLLPLVTQDNRRLVSLALASISKIGDPSIILAVREAAGDRFQAQFIEGQVIGKIRSRHARADARLRD